MARPISITKEKILATAIGIVRKSGTSALTARSLSSALGCGANAIFSKFGSMEGVLEAVRTEARRLFKERVGAGFSLNPPFKGMGLAFLWDTQVGFKQESIAAIGQSFGLQGKDAEMLYYQLMLVGIGLAHTCVEGGAALSIPQLSEILGKNVRAFLMVIRAGNDERESFMPREGNGPEGDVESYLLIHSLAGQNHLLQELHAAPRYIQDNEWVEMERVFRNGFSLTPESLREKHPNLTRGDVRLIMLSRLQFSVTEQALLLGISPASVTKARQRLKAKLGM